MRISFHKEADPDRAFNARGAVVVMGRAALCLGIAATVAAAGPAWGQLLGARPIRIITSAAGSNGEFTARIVAQGLTDRTGKQYIVENRAIAGVEVAARAAPDGYTLLAYGSPLWMSPLLGNEVSWNVATDFATISLTNISPNYVVVNPSLPVTSIHDLISYAKSKPGSLNYGSGSPGSASQLAMELFKSMAEVDIVGISYKGSGPAVTDLLAGRVQIMISSGAGIMAHVKSGKLRALAVTSSQPSTLAPGMPTVSASGVPDFETASMTGMFGPSKIPAAMVNQLSKDIAIVLQTPQARTRLLSIGAEPVGSTPEEFRQKINSEVERMGKVIKAAGIKGSAE